MTLGEVVDVSNARFTSSITSEKALCEERRCPPEEIGVVDMLQVLEGAAYVGFIAGAIFAVLELRTISRDRKIELLMRTAEFACTLEFETVSAKFIGARFQTPEEAEEQVSLPALMMIADYCETIGTLVEKRLVPKDVALTIFPFEYVWEKIKVWAEAPDIDDPDRTKYGPTYPSFKWLAGEARKIRLAEEQKANGV